MNLSQNSIQNDINSVTSEELKELPKLGLEELENVSAGLKRRDDMMKSQRFGDIIIDGAELDLD